MNASKNHWTDEDLLTRLYGLDARPHLAPAHLDECAECAERWARVSSARAEVLAAASSAACSEEELRAQRAAVWNRIERPGHVRLLRAVPALATCCVLLLAVALNRPAPQPPSQQVATAASDDQFFAEITKMANDDSPRAVESIRGLFSETANLEVQ